MKTEYYDIGLNLFCRQFPEPEKIIQNAAKAGVTCILTGTDRKENRQIDTFTKEHRVYGTVGIHPHNADRGEKADFDLIEKLVTENKKIVAIGECGLDFDRMFSTRENQIRCLEKHIVLAEKLGMPLFCMSAAPVRNLSEDSKNIRKCANGLWSIALPETGKHWRSILRWDFPSALPDGSAMTAGEKN